MELDEETLNRPLPQPTRWQRFVAWRKRYVRPVWCVRMAGRFIGSHADLEDGIYIAGMLVVAMGAERVFGNGYGLLAAGSLMLVPPMVSIIGINRKGPQK